MDRGVNNLVSSHQPVTSTGTCSALKFFEIWVLKNQISILSPLHNVINFSVNVYYKTQSTMYINDDNVIQWSYKDWCKFHTYLPTHCMRRQASVYQITDHLSERNRRLRRLKLHVPVCNIIMFVRFVFQQCMWSWYHSISLMYKYTNHCNSLPGLKSKDMLGYVCPKGCWLIDLRKKILMFYHKNMIVDSYLILIIYS